MIADGTYDAFVVDAEVDEGEGEAAGRGPVLHLELTILAGEHKGEVVEVATTTSLGDPIDLLGMPATLVVAGGAPSVRLDR